MAKGKNKINSSNAEEMKSLRSKGLSFRTIGKKFNVSHSTVIWHTNEGYKQSQLKRFKNRFRDRI